MNGKVKTKKTAASEMEAFNQLSLDALAKPYNTWMQSAAKLQDELMRFYGKRIKEDMELSARIAECNNAGEVLHEQLNFASAMFNDYASENLKLMEIVCDTADTLEHQAEDAITGPLQHTT